MPNCKLHCIEASYLVTYLLFLFQFARSAELSTDITSSVFFLFVEARIDLGFLIDGSENVGEQNFRISLDFVKNIYGPFWTQFGSLHLGLVVFGTETRLIFDFDNKYTDKTELNNAINSAAFPGGRTVAVGEALKLTETHLFGSKHHDSYRRILVVMMGSTSEDDVFLAAEMLKANAVTVFCVGVGNHYVRAQMDGIASQPSSDNILTAVTYPSLTSLTQKLIDKINEGRGMKSTSSLHSLNLTQFQYSPIFQFQYSLELIYPLLQCLRSYLVVN